MTELEMSLTLGLLSEPEKNVVHSHTLLEHEMALLKNIFAVARKQRQEIGVLNPDLWAELLPWHSLN